MGLMRRFAILAFVLAFTAAAQEVPPAQQPPVQQPPAQKPAEPPPPPVTPDQLLNALATGNKTFVAGKISFEDLKTERQDLRGGQAPPVTLLSCADSRVPPELIFNQSLGALFVVRAAGSVADEFGLASIEYAILQGYTKLIVVMGHENCGAVKAALGTGDAGSPALNELARRIRMSFVGVTYDPRDASNVRRAVEANTRASAAELLAASTVIRDAVVGNKVKMVTAYYDMGSGSVSLLGVVTAPATPLPASPPSH